MADVTRADRGARWRQRVLYKDVLVDFTLDPVTGSVGVVTNERAVAQALRSLLLTMNGEWPFEPGAGSALRRVLFEMNDGPGRVLVETTIRQAIDAQMPMVLVDAVTVQADKNWGVNVTVAYTITGLPSQPQTLSVVLKRVR